MDSEVHGSVPQIRGAPCAEMLNGRHGTAAGARQSVADGCTPSDPRKSAGNVNASPPGPGR